MNYRPQYHFTPPSMWMNDPNGMVYAGGLYHFFYQHNPGNPVWGPMHWGHAVSKDLMHWEHLPIALYPDALGTAYSGSCVLDSENTSGLGDGKRAPLVAIYTSHGEREQQSAAYSLDGVHFTPYPDNPVIRNTEYPDYRDPKVFRDPVNGGWGLVLASGDRDRFFLSNDLIHWRESGEFGPFPEFGGLVWECPDLYPIQGPDGKEYWILTASLGATKGRYPADMVYWIGSWDGKRFTTGQKEPRRTGFGRDDYAGVTFSGTREPVYMGWASQWVYANQTPTGDYRGQTTFARRLSLVPSLEGLSLASEPLGAAERMRETSAEEALASSAYCIRLRGGSGCSVVLSNGEESFRTGVNEDGTVYMDRTGLKAAPWSEDYLNTDYAYGSANRVLDGECEMVLYMDASVAEVYCDRGTRVGTMLLYPEKPFHTVEIQGKEAAFYRISDER